VTAEAEVEGEDEDEGEEEVVAPSSIFNSIWSNSSSVVVKYP